jgi:polyphosphate kinase 2
MSQAEQGTPARSITDMEERRPHPKKLDDAEYLSQLNDLQIELLKLQRHVIDHGQKVVILFEGRDAAGKGGAIKRFTEHLNPRAARTVALPKPTDTERGQWYFQRYTQNLPTTGEIVLFDRSWYNRAGVERVMGFCTPRQYGEFYRQVPGYEQALVESGIKLFKLWFTVSRDTQAKRFAARQQDPLKQWKFSPMDAESQARWHEYSEARNEMLVHADSTFAPWTVVNSNEKKRARLESIRSVLHGLDYEQKDPGVAHTPDPFVVRPAAEVMASSPIT